MSLALRRFDAVVFDMDGLLLDSERLIREAWLAIAAERGQVLSHADYAQTIGRPRPDCLLLMAQWFGDAAAAVYDAVDARVTERTAVHGMPLRPGARELLTALQARGVPLTVATSTAQAKAEKRLHAAGLRAFFGSLHGGDRVLRGKPHPDLFELAARTLDLPPERCLVFEDSSLGAQGALAAGMGVVLVPDLKAPEPEVAARCLVLNSLTDFIPRLDEHLSPD